MSCDSATNEYNGIMYNKNSVPFYTEEQREQDDYDSVFTKAIEDVLEIIDAAILDYKTDVELAIKKNDLMQAAEKQSHVHALKSLKAQIVTMEGGEYEDSN